MLNVTDLSSYLYCPRKLYLTKVLKLEETPKEVMILGTIRHKVYEDINNTEESLVTKILPGMGLPEVTAQYVAHYSKTLRLAIGTHKALLKKVNLDLQEVFVRQWKHIQHEAKIRATFVSSFIALHKLHGEALWHNLTPKISSEIRVESSTLALKGIVDQIEVFPGYLVPVELKTGNMAPTGIWPSHRVQLSAYMALLAEKKDKPVKEGKIRYLDHEAEKILPFNPFYTQEVRTMVTTVSQMLGQNVPPPYVENKNKCTSCSLKEKCYDRELIATKVREVRA